MKNKRAVIITTLVCLLPSLFGIIIWNKLPEQVPAHWNIAGEVDRYASRAETVFLIPIFMAVMQLVVDFAMKHEKRRKNYSKRLYAAVGWLMPAMSLWIMTSTYLAAFGVDLKMHVTVPLFISIMLLFIGNYLPKCRQNSTMGIRLPWTLRSEENWNRTHRMAGPLWTVFSLLSIIFALAGKPAVSLAFVITMIVVPIVYSFVLSRKGV